MQPASGLWKWQTRPLLAVRSSVRAARTHLFGRTLLAAALVAALVTLMPAVPTAAAPACTITWDGGGGSNSWHDAANWSTDTLPGVSDHVCIGTETVVFSQGTTAILTLQVNAGSLQIAGGSLSLTDTSNGSTVTNLTLSGGTLGGTGTLGVAGAFSWTGGTQTDAGTTLIASTASLAIDSGTTGVALHGGRTLLNQGTATWSSGDISMVSNPKLENASTGVFFVQGNDSVLSSAGGLIQNNGGIFQKDAGTGTTSIQVPFDNDGVVRVVSSSSTLRFEAGDDGQSFGVFRTTSGGTVDFAGGSFNLAGAEIGVAGDGGMARISGAAVNVSGSGGMSAGSLTLSGGLLGGPGTLAVGTSFTWTGGDQTGAGTTAISTSATLTIDGGTTGVALRGGRTLRNEGFVTWTSGDISMEGSARFENLGTFDARGDDSVVPVGSAGGLIHNGNAIFQKSAGTGTTSIQVPLDNDNVVQASSGTLSLEAGDDGLSVGSFRSGFGGTIDFAGGTFNLWGSEIGVLGDGGLAKISGATVNVFSGGMSANNLTLSGGTLGGTGTLGVAGAFSWTGGTQTDAGTTAIATSATLTIAGGTTGVALRGGRTLRNEGFVTWSGGDISMEGNARLENLGIVDSRGDDSVVPIGPAGGLIHNSGNFKKSAASGTTTSIAVGFSNDGTLEARSGVLSLIGPFQNFSSASKTLTGGTYLVSSTLRFTGADIVTSAANIELDGASSAILDEFGASGLRNLATNTTQGDLTVKNGRNLTTPGPLDNEGRVTIGQASEFTATGGYSQTAGTTTLGQATSKLTAAGGSVDVLGGTLAGIGSAGPAVNANGGDVSPGLSPGILEVTGDYGQSAAGTLAVEIGGATPGSDFDQLAVAGAAALNGRLRITTANGFTPSEGDSFKILTAAQRTGQFSSVEGDDIGSGEHYEVHYNPSDVTLVVAPNPGDILVADPNAFGGGGGIIRVNPGNGAQTTVSSGQLFNDPYRLAPAPNGGIFVADPSAFGGGGGIVRVDPASGTQTTVSSGGDFVDPIGVTIAENGSLLVADYNAFGGSGGIVRVDPTSGAQTTVSSGGSFIDPVGIALAANGDILVADLSAFGGGGGIIRVDPGTGVQTTVSTGGSFVEPASLVAAQNGEILVVDEHGFSGPGGVIRVDATSGAQTTVSSGGSFVDPYAIALAANGDILVADVNTSGGPGGVIRVDPSGGGQIPVSSGGSFVDPTGIAVVPDPPDTTIDSGPSGLINDPTPTFTFSSSQAGSTFECRVDGGTFSSCGSPHTTAPLTDAGHTFEVRAVNGAGTRDPTPASRSLTVDAMAPAEPTLTDTDPDSPSSDESPKVKGSAEAGSTVRLYTTSDCSGSPVATGSAADFASPGLTVSVADNSTTTFHAAATDPAGNTSSCSSSSISYVESSPGYPRPKGASPLRVPLVVAYPECLITAANRTHGPPLASPSCSSPAQLSSVVTVGTPDANGASANSIGSMRFAAQINSAPTPNDVLITTSITDVRCKVGATTTCGNANAAAGQDYAGALQARPGVRITDKFNAVPPGGGTDSATVEDTIFAVTVPCSSTASTAIGSSCVSSTSANALVPGYVKSGKRTIWGLDQVSVIDGGSDGDPNTSPNTLFARQGIFVP